MQAARLGAEPQQLKSIISAAGDDEGAATNNNDDTAIDDGVCVRDKEAACIPLLRPLAAAAVVENKQSPLAGGRASSPAAAASASGVSARCGPATAASESQSSSIASSGSCDNTNGNGDDDDVKNSRINQESSSITAIAQKLGAIVDEDPDRAGLGSLCAGSVSSVLAINRRQTKHGNQTTDEAESGTETESRYKGASVIIDSPGCQDASNSQLLVTEPSDALSYLSDTRATRELDRMIIPGAGKLVNYHHRQLIASIPRENVAPEPAMAAPTTTANSMGEQSAASDASLISGSGSCGASSSGNSEPNDQDDEGETITESPPSASIGAAMQVAPAAWSAAMHYDQANYEADTLRIIQSLHKQRRELQDMDMQLKALIASHLQSIGRPVEDDAAGSFAPSRLASPLQLEVSDYRFNQVIDLTTNRSSSQIEPQDRHAPLMDSAAHKLQSRNIADQQSGSAIKLERLEDTTPPKAATGNLGHFSSVNLRKSRLLGANVAQTYQAASEPEVEHKQQPAPSLKRASSNSPASVDSSGRPDEKLMLSASRRPIGRSPELLTHDIQQLKRLRLCSSSSSASSASAGHSAAVGSSGAFRASTSSIHCNSQSAATTIENSIDLLRDFMLHNQYLPAHLVLECLSQCQKQTSAGGGSSSGSSSSSSSSSNSTPPLTSMLSLPPNIGAAMSLIAGASASSGSPPPSSSASTSSSSGGSSATSSARSQPPAAIASHNMPDRHQQINQLDMVAAAHHHLNLNLNPHHHQQQQQQQQHHEGGASAAINLADFSASYYSGHTNATPHSQLAAGDANAPLGYHRQHNQAAAAAGSRAVVLASNTLDQNHSLGSRHPDSNRVSGPPPPPQLAAGDLYHQSALATMTSASSARHNNNTGAQQHAGSQETLELIRATMGANKSHRLHHPHHLQLQQQLQPHHHHHHHHLISMADIQQRVAFKCHVCGSGFEDRHRLQQHLSIHLSLQASWFEEKTIAETMAQYESKRGDYLCGQCDIRFETTSEFDKHMQAHGDKPHRCDLCSGDNKLVSFRYYRQLLTHLRSHCFLYSCRFAPDCRQTSNRRDYLKLHILKHHLNNQLPKQYTICCH